MTARRLTPSSWIPNSPTPSVISSCSSTRAGRRSSRCTTCAGKGNSMYIKSRSTLPPLNLLQPRPVEAVAAPVPARVFADLGPGAHEPEILGLLRRAVAGCMAIGDFLQVGVTNDLELAGFAAMGRPSV